MTSRKVNREARSSWKNDHVGGYKWFRSPQDKELAKKRGGLSWKQYKQTAEYKRKFKKNEK